MAGKKDQAVVAVIAGLTNNQAAQITKDIMKSKQKYAPNARGNRIIGTYVERRLPSPEG